MDLSIRIYGGDLVTGLNPSPLVSVGVAPDGFTPAPPTIVNEPRSYLIVHAKKYTYYAMHMKDRLTAANGQPGQLQLCLFMPAQKRLKEATPLALLSSLADTFTAIGTAPMPDGSSQLPQQALDSTPFNNVLARYKMEQRPMPLPEMQGQEGAAYCVKDQSQLEALMRHSRYQQLSKVGRLEIGFHCPTTVQLPIGGDTNKPATEPTAPPRHGAQPVDEQQPVTPQPATSPQPAHRVKPTPEYRLTPDSEPAPQPDLRSPRRATDNGRKVDPSDLSGSAKPKQPHHGGVDLGGGEPPVSPRRKSGCLKLLLKLLAALFAILVALIIIGRCGGKDEKAEQQPPVEVPDTIFTEDTMMIVPPQSDKTDPDQAEPEPAQPGVTDHEPINDHRDPAAEAAKKEAEEKAKAKQAEREAKRSVMLQHINAQDWKWVRQHEEECREYMSQSERDAVEALYLYNPATGMPYTNAQREFIAERIANNRFTSIQQIVQFKSVLMLELKNM